MPNRDSYALALTSSRAQDEPHRARLVAESFGDDAERYNLRDPRYPQPLVNRIMAWVSGREVLNGRIGAGVSARSLQAGDFALSASRSRRECGPSPARTGFHVELAKFEVAILPGGRCLVVARHDLRRDLRR